MSSQRWMRSQMTSVLRSSSRKPAPTMPISRWWSFVIWLQKCVMCLSPFLYAGMNSAIVAPVCPQLGTMPRLRHAAANAAPPGCSGAKEICFTGEILSIARTSFMSGLRTNFGFCAPQHFTLMNGPSRWMPITLENLGSFR